MYEVELVKQLMNYDMDAQVVDTFGSPIMYSVYAHPNKFVTATDCVRLEPKSQIDKEEWLRDFFIDAVNSCMSDRDVCDELKEQGWTLEDMKDYRQDTYEWALQYWDMED
jgi:hypothetical protein